MASTASSCTIGRAVLLLGVLGMVNPTVADILGQVVRSIGNESERPGGGHHARRNGIERRPAGGEAGIWLEPGSPRVTEAFWLVWRVWPHGNGWVPGAAR